jgi:predicted Ser/Thr protein kinase
MPADKAPIPDRPVPSDADPIDRICDDFEAAWKQGAEPPMARYLQLAGAADQVKLAYELALLDFEYRRRRGQAVAWDHYVNTYPELKDMPPPRTGGPAGVTRIGRYPVERVLGQGHQGAVYRARHPVLNVPVVIKWSRSPVSADDIIEEGRALAQLGAHPHLVRVHDCDVHDSRPFLVMECIEGCDLAEYVRGRNLELRDKLGLFLQIADTVQWLHERAVAHQDLKPQNVIVADDGTVKLIDFGLARVLGFWRPDTDVVGGTPRYMAPEVARLIYGENPPPPDAIDYRSADVFSLGGVLFNLVTGQPPYVQHDGEDRAALQGRMQRGEYDVSVLNASGAPRALARLCAAALDPDPGRRTRSASELAAGVRSVRDRGRRLRGAAVVAAVLIAAGIVLGAGGGDDDDPHPAPATRDVNFTLYVGRDGLKSDLPILMPVYDGEPIAWELNLPASTFAACFLVNGAGQLQLVKEFPATDSAQRLFYPGSGQGKELTGPAGTEFIFVCGRSSSAIDVQAVHAAWRETERHEWPALPDTSVLYVAPEKVWFDSETQRDLGQRVNVTMGPLAVRDRVEAFHKVLQANHDFVAGVAFPHKQGPPPEL